jgi:DNA-binding NtrC family response regulator
MALSDDGHITREAENGALAIKMLEEKDADLVITDLRLPDISGLDVLQYAKKQDPNRPVVLITAFASTETAVTAMKAGAFDYLEKPFHIEDLRLLITRALEQGELRRENVRLKEELAQHHHGGKTRVLGKSPPMRRVMELVKRVARTDATVLVTGESGTGKELIARAIHQHSPRHEHAFVAINCAAIPETLIESELFGHAKGSFSGAVNSRKGVFVEADHGTLLLDEIGEMPLNTQAKLLRALQEKQVRPVGASGDRSVDVRVVATTNRDLAREVAENRFREDLYYRINVVNLHLPSLRERTDDIPLLTAFFLDRCAKRHVLPARTLSPEAMDCLNRYPFPGNVRELENIIEGAVSLTLGERLELAALPERVRNNTPGEKKIPIPKRHALSPPSVERMFDAIPPPSSAPGHMQQNETPPDPHQPHPKQENDLEHTLAQQSGTLLDQVQSLTDQKINLEHILMETEKTLIYLALEKSGGNKTRAAELLGLTFRSFRYRLGKFE